MPRRYLARTPLYTPNSSRPGTPTTPETSHCLIEVTLFAITPTREVFVGCGLDPPSTTPPPKAWLSSSFRITGPMWEVISSVVKEALLIYPVAGTLWTTEAKQRLWNGLGVTVWVELVKACGNEQGVVDWAAVSSFFKFAFGGLLPSIGIYRPGSCIP